MPRIQVAQVVYAITPHPSGLRTAVAWDEPLRNTTALDVVENGCQPPCGRPAASRLVRN